MTDSQKKESVNAEAHRYARGQSVAIDLMSKELRNIMLDAHSTDGLEDLRVLAAAAMLVASETLANIKLAVGEAFDAKQSDAATELERLVNDWRPAFERQYEADVKTFSGKLDQRKEGAKVAASFARAMLSQMGRGGTIEIEVEDDDDDKGRTH